MENHIEDLEKKKENNTSNTLCRSKVCLGMKVWQPDAIIVGTRKL